ncbi:hypothetical protein CYY_006805 [Polysphondylium violaceum]|uniref:Tim44-like domain-containing protein n=1 Tax=Polysphondylium violaceum TaxID=133409 RepID=A0A8J4UYL0_9MYCE|nr:hypothetical protein CYY_006805 [Polysphondylium violaceum]
MASKLLINRSLSKLKNQKWKNSHQIYSISSNQLYSNSNSSLLFNSSSNNNSNTNGQQQRNISFFRDSYQNFKHLMKNDPDFDVLLSDFDKQFLNSYFEKKRIAKEKKEAEKEEKLAKEAAKMQEEMSKLQEQREKMTPEQVEELKERQRKLYEDMVNKREGKTSSKKRSKSKVHEMDPDQVVDADTTNKLKAKFDEASGNRPLPYDILREDESFDRCQDYSVTLGSFTKEYEDQLKSSQVNLEEDEMDAYRTMVLEAYAHCQKNGIKVDSVDIGNLEKEDYFNLPQPIIDYCEEQLQMFEEVRPDEDPDQEKDQEGPQRPLPIRSQLGRVVQPFITRAIAGVIKVVDFVAPPLTQTNALFASMNAKGNDLEATLLENEELLFPGAKYETFKVDCVKYLIPEFLYHFFQGNLFELKSLTTDDCYHKSKTIVNTMEGQYKVLCSDIRKSKVAFYSPYIYKDVVGFSFETTIYHNIRFRDFSGKMIKDDFTKEDQYYLTKINITVTGEPKKNKMGWVIANVQLAGPPYPLPEGFPIDEDD